MTANPDETEQRAEFDAWLASTVRAAKAEGWRDCAVAIQDGLGAWDALHHNPHKEDRHVDQ